MTEPRTEIIRLKALLREERRANLARLDADQSEIGRLIQQRDELALALGQARADLTRLSEQSERGATDQRTLFRERKRLARELDRARIELIQGQESLVRLAENCRSLFRDRKAAAKANDVAQAKLARLTQRFDDAAAAATSMAEFARCAAGEVSPDAPRTFAISPGAKPRDDAEDAMIDPLAGVAYRLGEIHQLRGELTLAAEAFRKAGPAIGRLLRRRDALGNETSGPDFLIIGPGRAGTAWLKKHLGHHPDITMLAREQHYFSYRHHEPPAAYVSRFLSAAHTYPGSTDNVRPSQTRVFGEKSPTYLAMPDPNIAMCAALFPNLRLVCMVRDPVALAWSHVKLKQYMEGSANLDFLRSKKSLLDDIIYAGRYRLHLTRWARHFRPDQILLVDFDKIASDPMSVYRDVLSHIGVRAAAPNDRAIASRIGATDQVEPPAFLGALFEEAYEADVWDIPSLRSAMDQASRGPATSRSSRSPGPPSRHDESVRLWT